MLAHIFVDYLFYRSVRLTFPYRRLSVDFLLITLYDLCNRSRFPGNGGVYGIIIGHFLICHIQRSCLYSDCLSLSDCNFANIIFSILITSGCVGVKRIPPYKYVNPRKKLKFQSDCFIRGTSSFDFPLTNSYFFTKTHTHS